MIRCLYITYDVLIIASIFCTFMVDDFSHGKSKSKIYDNLSYGYKHLTLFCIVFGYLYTKYIKVYRDNIKNKFYCLILFNQIKNIFLINISVSTYISSHNISINFHLLISFTFNIHIRFNDKNNL